MIMDGVSNKDAPPVQSQHPQLQTRGHLRIFPPWFLSFLSRTELELLWDGKPTDNPKTQGTTNKIFPRCHFPSRN